MNKQTEQSVITIKPDKLEFVMADDWLLFYKDEYDFMYMYNTEMWPEWLELPERLQHNSEGVQYMRPFRYNHKPLLVYNDINEPETYTEFQAGL